MKRIVLTLAAAAAGLFAAVMPASASVHAGHAAITAVTTLTNRPDSGAQGNDWALDNMTRTVSVKLVGEVAASNCPGTLTGHCYLWNASISDSGTFTTAAGQLAPRAGTLDSAITGAVKGGAPHVQFFSSWKTAKASLVPVSLDGTGGPRTSTTNWVEQFFGSSAVFNSAANPGGPDLANWSWTYTAGFGSDSACPNEAYQWVDGLTSGGGSLAADGNILANDAAHCGTLG